MMALAIKLTPLVKACWINNLQEHWLWAYNWRRLWANNCPSTFYKTLGVGGDIGNCVKCNWGDSTCNLILSVTKVNNNNKFESLKSV